MKFIERIKPALKKEYYIREMTLLVVMAFSLLCFGIYESLALFQDNIEKSNVATIKAGDIYITLTSTDASFNSSTKQITVNAGETKELPLTITNTTTISAKYKLYYKLISPETLPDGVTISIEATSEEGYDEGILDTNTSEERTITIENTSSSNITIQFGLEKGYAHNPLAINSGNNQLEAKLKEIPYFVDTTNANEPVLADGMIPVVYDDESDVWLVADTEKGYYAYQDQIWANAVTVSEASYRTASIGTPIPMDVINTMWVWIPRFKYNIPSNIGSSSAVTSPPQINVEFEIGTAATGVTEAVYKNGIASDGTNTNYYTHPAFRNIDNIEYDSSTISKGAWDEEITGFWVGKFETSIDGNVTTDNSSICYLSKSETNCNTSNLTPIIKPDVESLIYQNISNQFYTSLKFANGEMPFGLSNVSFNANSNNIYGLNTETNTTDTHMMKNTEWGAVAILSQSQYGKMGNVNYMTVNKEIYKNNSFNSTNKGIYTGRSSGLPPASGNTTYGTYSYNDKTCTTTEPLCTGVEVQYAGTGASTTGTIYGIYDMVGGYTEYTMSNWENSYHQGGFDILPSFKYYDLYYYDYDIVLSYITKEKAIFGDATYETIKWYSDDAIFIDDAWEDWDYQWTIRGEGANGIFYSNMEIGESANFSFHTILIP